MLAMATDLSGNHNSPISCLRLGEMELPFTVSNGYVLANNPIFETCKNDNVIWYTYAYGSGSHVFHMHGNGFTENGHPMPSISKSLLYHRVRLTITDFSPRHQWRQGPYSGYDCMGCWSVGGHLPCQQSQYYGHGSQLPCLWRHVSVTTARIYCLEQ